MNKKPTITPITNLFEKHLENLVTQSKKEGFRFLERLVNDYKTGTNTFSRPGEALYGVYSESGEIIALGGLNINPYSNDNKIGRLRRFYVAKNQRRNGIGKALVEKLLSHAKCNFTTVVLNSTPEADDFYVAMGFIKDTKYPNSTHFKQLE